MARTTAEQREYNRVKMNEYRARKKQKTTASFSPETPGVVVPVNGDTVATSGVVDELTVDVNVGTSEAPKLSLKERILAKMQGSSEPAKPAKRVVSRAKKQENLLTSTLPTVLCSFIATYSRELIADPYKPCAPSQEEVTGIIGPLMDILARQVEITGQASQTTIDLMNSLICALIFGVRSYMTYTQIKSKESPTHAEDRQKAYEAKLRREAEEYYSTFDTSEQPANLTGGMRSHQAASAGLGGNSHSQYASSENAYATETHDASGNANSSNGHSEGRDYEVALVSAMFSRDKSGRQQLGLLPVPVRDDS